VGFIPSLKVAFTLWFIATPVAALPGRVELTVGRVESATAPLVKLQTKLLKRGFPARSVAPVVIVAV
jgi:hypothetical protein